MDATARLTLACTVCLSMMGCGASRQHVATTPQSAGVSCADCAEVGELSRPLIDRHWVDTLAIGIVEGEATHLLTFGGAAADDSALYEIGSISKLLTTATLAVLVDEGVVGLEDRVSRFLPQIAEQDITLLELATHRSGLPALPTNLVPRQQSDPYAEYRAEDLNRFLAEYRQTGTEKSYQYGNLDVGLLGYVLAVRTGVPYEALVKSRVTEPLGMRDTVVTLDSAQEARFLQGHDADGMPVGPWHFEALQGAGAWRSTVADMVLFLKANLASAGQPLTRSLAVTHGVRDVLPDGSAVALGWLVTRDGWRWHNGETAGGHSFIAFSPDTGKGVVVLSNTASSSVDKLGMAIMNLLHRKAHALDIPDTIELPPMALQRYVGQYAFDAQTTIVIERRDATLSARLSGQDALRIYPASATRFYYRAVDASLEFVVQDNGDVSALRLHQQGAVSNADRVSNQDTAHPPLAQ